jgi:hypothetical protein
MILLRIPLITFSGSAILGSERHSLTGATPMTIAQRYNPEAARLLPHMATRLAVDPAITTANAIDEIVFRRSEFLGGMACAILAMLEQQGRGV